MKLKYTIFLIILCIITMTISSTVYGLEDGYYKIIKIVDADTFYIDFNSDGIAQQEERSRLNGVNSFELKYYNKITDREAEEYNFSYDEIYALGYLGKLYAEKELLNKNVKVSFSGKRQKGYYGRNLVSIYYGRGYSKDFAKELLKKGLAGIYSKSNIAKELKPYLNKEQIYTNAKATHNLVILNKRNKKYHKLGCPYGQKSQYKKIININKIKKRYVSANCCNIVQTENFDSKKILLDDGTINIFYIRARDYNLPSKETRTEAGKILIKIINDAQETVDFAFYGLAEQPELLNALLNAQKRGVKVRGIIDLNLQGKNDYTDTARSISAFSKGTIKSDYYADLAKYNKLEQQNAKYKDQFNGHIMHNKFCIVDKKIVWTGTANISSTGIGGFNENVVILINSTKLAELYTKEMNQMYKKGKFHEFKKEIHTKNTLLIAGTEVEAYFSPTQYAVIYGIIPEIKNAKESIYISMFLISHYQIVQELINAKKRGVDVKMIVEANHALQKYSQHERLRMNGIPVKVENWAGKMHAKLAVIDEKNIILGSTNWTKAGFLYNDENLLILRNIPKSAKYLSSEFQKSWDSIPDKWLNENPRPEGADSPGSCMDGLDNDYNGLIDAEDPNCRDVINAKYPSIEAKQRLK